MDFSRRRVDAPNVQSRSISVAFIRSTQRQIPRGRIILGYFFGPKFNEVPGIDATESLQPRRAIKRLLFGDLGLINGEWRVLGELVNWRRADWPVPQFVRRDDISKRAWRISYSDSDPSKLVAEEPAPFDVNDLENGQLWGYGAIEQLLTKLLESRAAQ